MTEVIKNSFIQYNDKENFTVFLFFLCSQRIIPFYSKVQGRAMVCIHHSQNHFFSSAFSTPQNPRGEETCFYYIEFEILVQY